MIVLGIDPGLATTGWGVVQRSGSRVALVDYGVISTKKTTDHAYRLLLIHKELKVLIKKFSPELIAVEQLFFHRNVTTALKVGEARGVVLFTAAQTKLRLLEMTPLQVKQSITSYGRADKQQVQRMVKAILGMKEIPKPDDAADALAIALSAAQMQRALH